ncbi:RDD family protein [Zunongwangia pacifica]|uniref:RDD family protein n=1 Tax=Zunongwangia pacifica TaxID=2911062 RepID=A0A9X1ZQ67_9FLAO|nr:RDD family protein [Zunongwangia pacifica]MCL6217989.1 RDD family protein [Zunongwangia pacifica]
MQDFEFLEEPKPKYIGRRYLAGFIDYAIVNTIAFMLIFIMGTPDGEGNYHLNGLPALLPVLFWFLFTVCLETWFGATVGNSIVHLKPITLSGYASKDIF